jgi:hypothetical protein
MSLLDRVRTAVGTTAPPAPAASVAAADDPGFDHVEIPKGDGSMRRLERREFEALPLQERVGLLVQGTLRFYRGQRQVAASDALRSAY